MGHALETGPAAGETEAVLGGLPAGFGAALGRSLAPPGSLKPPRHQGSLFAKARRQQSRARAAEPDIEMGELPQQAPMHGAFWPPPAPSLPAPVAGAAPAAAPAAAGAAAGAAAELTAEQLQALQRDQQAAKRAGKAPKMTPRQLRALQQQAALALPVQQGSSHAAEEAAAREGPSRAACPLPEPPAGAAAEGTVQLGSGPAAVPPRAGPAESEQPPAPAGAEEAAGAGTAGAEGGLAGVEAELLAEAKQDWEAELLSAAGAAAAAAGATGGPAAGPSAGELAPRPGGLLSTKTLEARQKLPHLHVPKQHASLGVPPAGTVLRAGGAAFFIVSLPCVDCKSLARITAGAWKQGRAAATAAPAESPASLTIRMYPPPLHPPAPPCRLQPAP